MPTFFFDLRTRAGLDPDELGADFPSLEAAYLDASSAVIDMSADFMRQRVDPSDHVFEVRNDEGDVVLELPFREMLRPGERAPGRRASELQGQLRSRLARNRELRADLQTKLDEVRCTIESARATVRRARVG